MCFVCFLFLFCVFSLCAYIITHAFSVQVFFAIFFLFIFLHNRILLFLCTLNKLHFIWHAKARSLSCIHIKLVLIPLLHKFFAQQKEVLESIANFNRFQNLFFPLFFFYKLYFVFILISV